MLTCMSATVSNTANATPQSFARWSNESALTTFEDRMEFGVTSDSSWAVSKRVELRTHPLVSLIAPRLSGKVRWLDHGPWHVSSEHSAWYPTLLLDLVAKEGTGGLLPPDAQVPQALIVGSDLIVSWSFGRWHWLTLRGGAEVGPRSGDATLLDFPFLYNRVTVLNSSVQPSMALAVTGSLVPRLDYEIRSDYRWLNLTEFDDTYAWENELDVGWSLSERWRISVGARTALARFPIGERFHWFPVVDLRFSP